MLLLQWDRVHKSKERRPQEQVKPTIPQPELPTSQQTKCLQDRVQEGEDVMVLEGLKVAVVALHSTTEFRRARISQHRSSHLQQRLNRILTSLSMHPLRLTLPLLAFKTRIPLSSLPVRIAEPRLPHYGEEMKAAIPYVMLVVRNFVRNMSLTLTLFRFVLQAPRRSQACNDEEVGYQATKTCCACLPWYTGFRDRRRE